MTMHMVMIGTTWNFGMPKRSGITASTQAADATLSKCMIPSSEASTAPAMMPSNTATLAMKPVNQRIKPRITSSTNSAMPKPSSWP